MLVFPIGRVSGIARVEAAERFWWKSSEPRE
jgi:hypothetical protein